MNVDGLGVTGAWKRHTKSSTPLSLKTTTLGSKPTLAQPLVVALLRRIAYTLLALFRSVTQRSDDRRAVPWKTLMSELAFALVTTTDEELSDTRHPRLC